MRHDKLTLSVPVAYAFIAACCLSLAMGCGHDRDDRAAALATPSARRLVGVWDAVFWLDRQYTLMPSVPDTSPVSGTIVLDEDTHGTVSAEELESPTHVGVYDIDFSRFGFSTREGGSLPGAIARVGEIGIPQRVARPPQPATDSLFIVLSPGTPVFTVRMNGRIMGDSASGAWVASTYRSAGGSGHFVMRRAAAR